MAAGENVVVDDEVLVCDSRRVDDLERRAGQGPWQSITNSTETCMESLPDTFRTAARALIISPHREGLDLHTDSVVPASLKKILTDFLRQGPPAGEPEVEVLVDRQSLMSARGGHKLDERVRRNYRPRVASGLLESCAS